MNGVVLYLNVMCIYESVGLAVILDNILIVSSFAFQSSFLLSSAMCSLSLSLSPAEQQCYILTCSAPLTNEWSKS